MKKIKQKSKSIFTLFFYFVLSFVIASCLSAKGSSDNSAPLWTRNLERSYPNRDWIAVVAKGDSQQQAEAAAMQALVRIFRTNVESITNASMQFSQAIDNSAGSRIISFNESKNFSQEVQISSSIRGLIGVQIDVYSSDDGTVHVCARMNRRECAARYSAMVKENSNVIGTLLAAAAPVRGSLDVYSKLSFAHSIAQVTDNFQHILEVLDPSAANRKPAYGGANAVKARMLEAASLITIGITLNTEQAADRILLTRAIGSFYSDLGFKINEQGNINSVDYILQVNTRFETIVQNVISCRYFLNAALSRRGGTAIFSFTEDDRKAHPNNASEARRLAVQAAEASFKEGNFANEFRIWLNSFLD